MTGAWLLLFKSERHIFTDVLDTAVDEHFSWDFYPHKTGRIDASLLRIEFVDVQAHRAIGKTQCVESRGIRHWVLVKDTLEVPQGL